MQTALLSQFCVYLLDWRNNFCLYLIYTSICPRHLVEESSLKRLYKIIDFRFRFLNKTLIFFTKCSFKIFNTLLKINMEIYALSKFFWAFKIGRWHIQHMTKIHQMFRLFTCFTPNRCRKHTIFLRKGEKLQHHHAARHILNV